MIGAEGPPDTLLRHLAFPVRGVFPAVRRTALLTVTMMTSVLTAVDAQQVPAFGCGASPSCSGPRGFSTLSGNLPGNLLGSRLWQRTPPEVRLILPPDPVLLDGGAIEVTAEIVLARNPKLRESLAIAMAANDPKPDPAARPAGEALIRIVGRPAPRTRRDDVPENPFVAMPLRTVRYPQFPTP